MKTIDLKSKKAAIIVLLIGMVAGYFISNTQKGLEIDYLEDFSIKNTDPTTLYAKGWYRNGDQIYLSKIECSLLEDICREDVIIITSNYGSHGIITAGPHPYTITEQSPTRIVATLKGLASTHTYVIDVSENRVTKIVQDNDREEPTSYQLGSGDQVLSSARF